MSYQKTLEQTQADNQQMKALLTAGDPPKVEQGSNQGLKLDDGKPPIALVDAAMIEGVAAVMGFGAKKYAAHNWRKGLQLSRCLSAAMRHILAFVRGEDIDPESGLPHIDHAICSLQFARAMWKDRPDMDDRYKGEVK